MTTTIRWPWSMSRGRERLPLARRDDTRAGRYGRLAKDPPPIDEVVDDGQQQRRQHLRRPHAKAGTCEPGERRGIRGELCRDGDDEAHAGHVNAAGGREDMRVREHEARE